MELGKLNPRVDIGKVAELTRELLIAIGENPDREGLIETPNRVARFWGEFMNPEPANIATTFIEPLEGYPVVIVSGIRVWSLCEHHLLPFWCDVSIAYQPSLGKILGLSKFARVAELHAHRLQVQERMINDITNQVVSLTGSSNVAVVGVGLHTCMVMRGVEKVGLMTTIDARGKFKGDQATINTLLNMRSATT